MAVDRLVKRIVSPRQIDGVALLKDADAPLATLIRFVPVYVALQPEAFVAVMVTV